MHYSREYKRLSTFFAGAFLLFLLVVLGPIVGKIPMPALVAVMVMVSIALPCTTIQASSSAQFRTSALQLNATLRHSP